MKTRNLKPGLLVLLPALLLNACATTSAPTFDTIGVDPFLTPQSVAASPQAATGRSVQWGGTIIGVTNLEDRTRIEVLAYPIDRNAKPQGDGNPLGRFFLEQRGFLDPATYKPGRLVSVVGSVTGTLSARVGEASYEHPVVDARQTYLWPENREYGSDTGVTFGIGVGTWGSGTNWGTGVGIGF
jgi:outer membrane lipoprotein